jgi:hypothetical protein
MTQTEALRLALEALTNAYWPTDSDLLPAHNIKECAEAITAIKAALEAKDEPWEKFCDSNCVWTDHHPDCKLAKDEPVEWKMGASGIGGTGVIVQPQRTWVGLTDEEILAKCESVPDYDIGNHDLIHFARAIEAQLRSKNT